MMSTVTDAAADLHPNRIPGYHDGPFARRPELLDQRLFWHSHLDSCAQGNAGRALYGDDYDQTAIRDFDRQLWGRGDWPVFTIPLAAGHRLHVVYHTVEHEAGVDFLVHHPDWDEADLVAREDGHYQLPGLSWAELVAAADNALPGGTVADSHARLLLLLHALGDNAIPKQAVHRLAAALSTRFEVEDLLSIADDMLESQGLAGAVQWTTVHADVRINDGRYSRRNPAGYFALSDDRLARVSAALTGGPHPRS